MANKALAYVHLMFTVGTASANLPAEETFEEPHDLEVDTEGVYITTETKPRLDEAPKDVVYFYPMSHIARVKAVSK